MKMTHTKTPQEVLSSVGKINGWKKKQRNKTLSAAVNKRNRFSRFASSPRSPSLRRLQANESEAGSTRLTRFEERVITDP